MSRFVKAIQMRYRCASIIWLHDGVWLDVVVSSADIAVSELTLFLYHYEHLKKPAAVFHDRRHQDEHVQFSAVAKHRIRTHDLRSIQIKGNRANKPSHSETMLLQEAQRGRRTKFVLFDRRVTHKVQGRLLSLAMHKTQTGC